MKPNFFLLYLHEHFSNPFPPMKRFIIWTILSFLPLCLSGQTQRGLVKSLGRPGREGEALENVIIRAAGQHNSVISDDHGAFSLILRDIHVGEGYAFQNIIKTGFVLVDEGVIGRTYAFSETVPVQITMTMKEQLQADKLRIETNTYRTAESQYKSQLEEAERALSEQTITEAFYREQIHLIQARFEKYQLMIDSISDHFARVDYDGLSDDEIEINTSIENGDIDQAYAMMEDRHQMLARIDELIANTESLIQSTRQDEHAFHERQKRDAEDLYRLYTISLARFDNAMATKYIQTRAALDTTILEWQIDAGIFLENYMSDYSAAKVYYERARHIAEEQYGKDHYLYARTLNLLGSLSSQEARFKESAQYHFEALGIQQRDIDNPDAAESLDNLGVLYCDQHDYEKALSYHEQALQWKERFPDDSLSIALSYNNIGVCKSYLKQYVEAKWYHQKALDIFLDAFGENNLDVSLTYANLGEVFFDLGDDSQALDYLQKSLSIRKRILGNKHPYIAVSLNNIAGVLNHRKDYKGAIECMEEALAINLAIYGDTNPEVALCLNNLGGLYCEMQMYPEALDALYEALSIYQVCFGQTSVQVANTYENLAGVYLSSGNFKESFRCLRKSRGIRKQIKKR